MSKEAPPDPYAAQRARVEALYASQERQVADLNPNVKTHREAIKKAKQRAEKAAAADVIRPAVTSACPPGFPDNHYLEATYMITCEDLAPPVFVDIPVHCTNFWRNGFCLNRDCPSPMHVMTLKPEVGEE
jgi:hypothetical protein